MRGVATNKKLREIIISQYHRDSKRNKTGVKKQLAKLKSNKTLKQNENDCFENEEMLHPREETRYNNFNTLFKTRSGRRALATLFDEAGSQISGEIVAILVALGKIASACIAYNLIEKLGRKTLILISSGVCGVSMLMLGIYFYFKENDVYIPEKVNIIPVIFIVTFTVVYSFGLAPVPLIIINELLPNEARSLGASIVFWTSNIVFFIITFAYPLVAEYLGIHVCMFTFSAFCFIGFVFVLFILPETKGKSYSEIQEMLNK
ncbi:unnamed protein product [Psylliodes chrysocephalus]|uniref:Major facilitator superfamily (MFS) profile domain-containing protein n=1 Tax=Psylliodes chrysocephalus TaxID=3402493 RepID=A0A9P0CR30_9CUCU|nr:unnamed protein product [Psylliodes chrysocephala]